VMTDCDLPVLTSLREKQTDLRDPSSSSGNKISFRVR
jgi:hypothetical protein